MVRFKIDKQDDAQLQIQLLLNRLNVPLRMVVRRKMIRHTHFVRHAIRLEEPLENFQSKADAMIAHQYRCDAKPCEALATHIDNVFGCGRSAHLIFLLLTERIGVVEEVGINE